MRRDGAPRRRHGIAVSRRTLGSTCGVRRPLPHVVPTSWEAQTLHRAYRAPHPPRGQGLPPRQQCSGDGPQSDPPRYRRIATASVRRHLPNSTRRAIEEEAEAPSAGSDLPGGPRVVGAPGVRNMECSPFTPDACPTDSVSSVAGARRKAMFDRRSTARGVDRQSPFVLA